MDAIYQAWLDHRLSNREAVEAILCHPEYGGNRDDAESVVDEWATEWSAREQEEADEHARYC